MAANSSMRTRLPVPTLSRAETSPIFLFILGVLDLPNQALNPHGTPVRARPCLTWRGECKVRKGQTRGLETSEWHFLA